ncbi:hypothetical protein THIOSC15_2740002 [uncultured Thiomicrorhabdus sp.]
MDRTAKTANKLGLTTESLTSLRFAVEQTSDVTAGQFDTALQRMTRRLSEAAQGTGEAKNALEELGLSAVELQSMSPDMAFKAIAEQMSKVGSQSDRVRLAFKLFDTEGVGLVNTLGEGVDAIEKLQAKAVSMGITFNGEAAKSAEKFNDELDILGKTAKGTFMTLATQSGALETLTKSFMGWSIILDGAVNKGTELTRLQREIINLTSEINKGQSLFGNSYIDILNKQRELNRLKQKELELIGSVNKLTRGDVGLNLQLEKDNLDLSELDQLFNEVDNQFQFMERRWDETSAFRNRKEYQPTAMANPKDVDWSTEKDFSQDTMLAEQVAAFGEDSIFKGAPSATGDWSSMLEGQTGLFDQDIANSQNQIQTLESLYAEGLDRERMFRDERLGIVQTALDNESISTERAAALKNQIEADYQQSQFATASEGFGMIAGLMNSKSKKMFEIGKKAAIVQATIDTYQSAISAYKAMAGIPVIGPALGAASAAAAVAMGMQQVSAINSQQFTPSAEGGFDIPAGVNPVTQLHEKEMVLPKAQAEIIRQMANNNGSGGAVGGSSINFNVTATDGQDVERMLIQKKDLIVNLVRRGMA